MGTERPDRFLTEILGEDIPITPSELVSRTIKKQAVGGYDIAAVDDLLEHAAEALDKLMTRVRDLTTARDEQRTQLDEYREIESSLRDALLSSQKFGEDIVSSAKREAEIILAEARLQRDEVQAEAARLPETITREIRLLIEERDRIREDILAVLDAHRHWVEQRVPERDSALSERLLAFVNSRQGVALDDAHNATQAPPPVEEDTDNQGHDYSLESAPDGEDLLDNDDALPDVVLGLDMEGAVEFDGDNSDKANDIDKDIDKDNGEAVLEAVAEEDDFDEIKEPTA
jgi:cell division initiation protein